MPYTRTSSRRPRRRSRWKHKRRPTRRLRTRLDRKEGVIRGARHFSGMLLGSTLAWQEETQEQLQEEFQDAGIVRVGAHRGWLLARACAPCSLKPPFPDGDGSLQSKVVADITPPHLRPAILNIP